MSQLYQRQLAAVLLADVAGSTPLMQRNEDAAIRALEETEAIARNVVAEHRGNFFGGEGDSFLGQFVSAIDAVQCA